MPENLGSRGGGTSALAPASQAPHFPADHGLNHGTKRVEMHVRRPVSVRSYTDPSSARSATYGCRVLGAREAGLGADWPPDLEAGGYMGKIYPFIVAAVLFGAMSTEASAWYCRAVSHTGAWGWGRSNNLPRVRWLAFNGCARGPSGFGCAIRYCVP